MKIVLIACVCFVAVFAEEYYKTQENFDIQELLQNDRLLVSYIKCLLNQAPCTPAVKEVKDKLPEALSTNCVKCTDQQKQIGKQLVKEVKSRHPDLWKELTVKYDSDGKHRRAFQEFLQS